LKKNRAFYIAEMAVLKKTGFSTLQKWLLKKYGFYIAETRFLSEL
jgi:hypothetical protein